jgi:mono/diheme cytochrome c family protein
VLALLAALALTGCEREMRNMYEQPRYDPGEPSSLWPDGKAMREPVPGTVAFASGDLAATTSGRRGEGSPLAVNTAQAPTRPPPVTLRLLQRGQERYTIYCQPCHSPLGDGDGPVVRRGFPHPPSYHQPRLRIAPDKHYYDVITHGYGVMVPYADRVTPEDRWAIVAYIRALQLSQHAQMDQLPPDLQAALRRLPATPALHAPAASDAEVPR